MKVIATGKARINGVTIQVNIHKIKNNFGKLDYTISPKYGNGVVKKRIGVVLDSEYKHLLDRLHGYFSEV